MSDDLTRSQIKMLNNIDPIFEHKILNSFVLFWVYVFKKIIFTCISVKVLSLVGFSWLNAWLVVNAYITGSNFAAIQICLISTVLVAREYSKAQSNTIVDKIINNPIVDKIKDTVSPDQENSD